VSGAGNSRNGGWGDESALVIRSVNGRLAAFPAPTDDNQTALTPRRFFFCNILMAQFYLLEAKDKGEILRGTEAGGKALYVFKTHDSANAYIAHKGREGEWKTVEIEQAVLADRLTTAKKYGLTDIIADIPPGTDESNVRLLPVDTFLLILDLNQ
jgi:hypothetical protein